MLYSLLGSRLRERILLYLLEAGEGYATQMARQLEAALFAVQCQLRRLEDGGVLVSRSAGKTRMYSLNPRYYLRRELRALLRRSLESLPREEIIRYYRPRNRPRRSGKPA